MAGLDPVGVRRLLEHLQSDLKTLSLETKKRHPGVKESAEEAIVKIRNAGQSNTPLAYLSNQILYPLVQGCETKDSKVVTLCLQVVQRLITAQVLDGKGAKYVVETMWMLMEAGLEEVRLLQTLTLLTTTNSVCQGDSLARCLVICFRLAFSKDGTVAATAGATVRHLVTAVFDRCQESRPATGVQPQPPASAHRAARYLHLPSYLLLWPMPTCSSRTWCSW